MTLTTIEHGSIASSETMNNNFSYLDEKINTSNSQINTSISSILSNIATINSSLSDLTESVTVSLASLQSMLADYKNKTKLLVAKASVLPNWSSCRAVTLSVGTSYTAASNGFILILPETTGRGNIEVNGVSLTFKTRENAYDNAAELISIPVKSGDVVSTTTVLSAVYFVSAAEVTIDNF